MKSLLLGMKFNIKILKLNKNMSNFHPPEFVDRGSETQIQVGENLNYLI